MQTRQARGGVAPMNRGIEHWAIWAGVAQPRCLPTPAPTMPVTLRLILTGEDQGPELTAVLPLIGRPRVLEYGCAAHNTREKSKCARAIPEF